MKRIFVNEAQFKMLMRHSLLNEDGNAVATQNRSQVGSLGHLEIGNPHLIDFREKYPDFDERDSALTPIHQQYAAAMSKRRPDCVTDSDTFKRYATKRGYAFEWNGSYLFGYMSNGYFRPSHFAPASQRGGYALIKELSKYDNVIFAVTDDLAPMLKKAGLYFDDNVKIPAPFKGEIHSKEICTTDKNLFKFMEKEYAGKVDVDKAIERFNAIKNGETIPTPSELVFMAKAKSAGNDMTKIITSIPGANFTPETADILQKLMIFRRDKSENNPSSEDYEDLYETIKNYVDNSEASEKEKETVVDKFKSLFRNGRKKDEEMKNRLNEMLAAHKMLSK